METGVSMGLGMRRAENIKIEYSRGRCIKVVNIRLKIHSTFFFNSANYRQADVFCCCFFWWKDLLSLLFGMKVLFDLLTFFWHVVRQILWKICKYHSHL